jgi:CubicO group peptidase (beta-lactamase class C family)
MSRVAARYAIAAGLAAMVLAGCASPGASDGLAPGAAASSGPAAPRFAPGGPDADEYGAGDGYPIGDRTTFYRLPFLVGSHSHLDQLFESRPIRRSPAPSALARAASEPALRYTFQDEQRTLDEYLARNPTTGLIVAKGDRILVERYQYRRTDRHRFTSWSMAKTVTSMLIGIAIAEGRIRSVNDVASTYVPELAPTEYGRTSGVRFLEEYSGRDDVTRLARHTFLLLGPGGVAAVTPFNERATPTGTRFSYASVETQVLGLVLRASVGRPVARYLEEKIWQPMGAEADATWLVDDTGQESTYCCLNAVLRDYARLGLLLAHDGKWRGRQLIPAAWVRAASRSEAPHLRPGGATPFFGYGYQTWIFPGPRRMFALLGVRGQSIFVDPASRLVMVHTAVRRRSVDPGVREAIALWRGIVQTLGEPGR